MTKTAIVWTKLNSIECAQAMAQLTKLGYKVEERKIDIAEVAAAAAKGILNDAFGTGTAASIAPIDSFGYQGNILQVKPMSERKISTHIKQRLDAIKCGAEADKFGWIEAVN